jgi:hypothetical protein
VGVSLSRRYESLCWTSGWVTTVRRRSATQSSYVVQPRKPG